MVPPVLLPEPAIAEPVLEPEDPLEPELVLPAPELVLGEVEAPLIPAAPVVGVTIAGEPAVAGLAAAPEGVAPLLLLVPAAVGGVDGVVAAGVLGDAIGVVEPAAPKPGAGVACGSIIVRGSSDPQPAPKAIATDAAAAMLNADR